MLDLTTKLRETCEVRKHSIYPIRRQKKHKGQMAQMKVLHKEWEITPVRVGRFKPPRPTLASD